MLLSAATYIWLAFLQQAQPLWHLQRMYSLPIVKPPAWRGGNLFPPSLERTTKNWNRSCLSLATWVFQVDRTSHIPKRLQSSFALTPDGQRLPPSASRKYFKINTSKQYDVVIGPKNKSSGDFTLGITWLRRFFVIYDSDNQRVGVANTPYTNAIVNWLTLMGLGPIPHVGLPSLCVVDYHQFTLHCIFPFCIVSSGKFVQNRTTNTPG